MQPGFLLSRFKLVLWVASLVLLVACSSGDDDSSDGGGTPPPAPGPLVFVFGDSLSDAGNLARPAAFADGFPPPFYQNRISNGPVVVDYVASLQGRTLAPSDYLSLEEQGTNYAVSGAKAYDDGVSLDLAAQLASFRTKRAGIAPADAIYLVFMGGNDVLGLVGTGPDRAPELTRAADEVVNAVQELAGMGAQRVFVLNVPDVGKTPRLIDDQTEGAAERQAQGTSLTTQFNAEVAARLNALPPSALRVDIIDVNALFGDVLVRYRELGYANATQACYITDEFRFSDICSEAQLEGFVFFDDIHPSGKTHRLIGEQVAREIDALLDAAQ